MVSFVLLLSIELSYWKYTTGHWVHYAYEGEHFNFSSPHIADGLFSYRKGWFVYTPLALIGVCGLIPLARKYVAMATLIAVYIGINIYIVFSWEQWFYGGSFGCRALIEALAVVAIPLAMLTQWGLDQKKRVLTISMFTVFGFLITLNLFQSYQLRRNVLVWDDNNRAYYWHTFGKLEVTATERELLKNP